jgi:phage protein D
MAGNVSAPLTNAFSSPGIGDQFAPFFRVRFITTEQMQGIASTDGEETDETIPEAAPLEFSEQGDQLRSYATSLEIVNQGGGMNVATLQLNPPFEDGIRIVDNAVIQWNSVMVCEWGWLNSHDGDRITSEPHYFAIQQPSVSVSGTDYDIKIVGADLFGFSSTKRSDLREYPRTGVFSTDLGILKFIARKNKMRLNVDLVPAESSLRQNKRPTATSGKVQKLEQNEKDWVFFNRLATTNNCSFYTVGDVIFVVDNNVAIVQNASYRLTFFQQPQSDRDVTMQSFSTNALDTLFTPAAAKLVRCVSNDPADNETQVADHETPKMEDEAHQEGRSASGTAVEDGRTIQIGQHVQVIPHAAFSETEVGKLCHVPHGQQNAEEFGKQPARAANFVANTDAQATMPGVPHMMPMMQVMVTGVGEVFGGVYLIQKTTHRLDTSGYETSVEMVRNTSTGTTEGGAGKGINPTNTQTKQEAPEGGGDVVPETPAEEA